VSGNALYPHLGQVRRLLEASHDDTKQLANDFSWHRPCPPAPLIAQDPWPKQQAFLSMEHESEVMYGDSGGGGKSSAMLMAALQYTCVPGYSALLLRQTYPQLIGEDGLIPRAEEWLAGTAARWVASELQWKFPSGASLHFGHCERDADRFKFSGHAYQFVGLDELPNWPTPKIYLFVGFARRRKPDPNPNLKACPSCGLTLAEVPLRTRATGNPGGAGHSWVRRRFGIQLPGARPEGRWFVPARLADNPSLNREEYAKGLMELGPVERAQILAGDWTVRESGRMFKREWFTGSTA